MKKSGNTGDFGSPGQGYVAINKFGENADIDTAAAETIWSNGGQFPFLDVGIEMDIISTDVLDTILGTGARTVELTRYDTDSNETIATFDMNGTGRTQIPGVVKLGSRIEVMSTGDLMTNAGRILLVDRATGLIIYQAVEIGEGQTLSTPQMCPAGKTGLVKYLYATYARVANRNGAQLKFRLRKNNGTILTKWPTTISTDNPFSEKEYKIGGVTMVAGDVIYWECVSVTANDTPIEAGFDVEFQDI